MRLPCERCGRRRSASPFVPTLLAAPGEQAREEAQASEVATDVAAEIKKRMRADAKA